MRVFPFLVMLAVNQAPAQGHALLSPGEAQENDRMVTAAAGGGRLREDPPIVTDPQVKQWVAWASSTEQADLERLRSALSPSDAIHRVDAQDHLVRYATGQLQIALIFRALADNPSSHVPNLLVAWTQAPAFQENDKWVELLIKALARLDDPPREVLAYLERHSGPDSIHTFFAIGTLCKMRSRSSVQLVKRRLLDRAYSTDDRQAWLRQSFIESRYQHEFLNVAEELLGSSAFPRSLKTSLIDVLFDYRPTEWYNTDSVKPQPDWHLMPAAKERLRSIAARFTEPLRLTRAQRVAIQQTLDRPALR